METLSIYSPLLLNKAIQSPIQDACYYDSLVTKNVYVTSVLEDIFVFDSSILITLTFLSKITKTLEILSFLDVEEI